MKNAAECNTKLFNEGTYTLHSGLHTRFKIDCDALTDRDIDDLAWYLRQQVLPSYTAVIGVPKGGTRLANALCGGTSPKSDTVLIVDDVYTTGKSIQEYADLIDTDIYQVKGLVMFSRTLEVPDWIHAVFKGDIV